ncbi:hypothetical protein N9T26_01600 [Alphaproteobacteria bacterium]|nr:hypothetical protein [Alphaproteobacteria bacterium]
MSWNSKGSGMVALSNIETIFQEKRRLILMFSLAGLVVFLAFEPRFLKDFNGSNILLSTPLFKFSFLFIAAFFSTILNRLPPHQLHISLLLLCNFEYPIHVFIGLCILLSKSLILSNKETLLLAQTSSVFCFVYLVLIYFGFDFSTLYWDPLYGLALFLSVSLASFFRLLKKSRYTQAILKTLLPAIVILITVRMMPSFLQILFLAVMSFTFFLLIIRSLIPGKRPLLIYFLIFLTLSCSTDLIIKQIYIANDECTKIVCKDGSERSFENKKLDHGTIKKISEQAKNSGTIGSEFCAKIMSKRILASKHFSNGKPIIGLKLIISSLDEEQQVSSPDQGCSTRTNLLLKRMIFSKVLDNYSLNKGSIKNHDAAIVQKWTSDEFIFLSEDHLTKLFADCPKLMECMDSIDAILVKIANRTPLDKKYGDFYQLSYLLNTQKLLSDQMAISLLKTPVQNGHEDAIASLLNIVLAKGIENRHDLLILKRMIDISKTGSDLQLVAANSIRYYILNFGLFDYKRTCKIAKLKLQNIYDIKITELKHQNWSHFKGKLEKQLKLVVRLCDFPSNFLVKKHVIN